jgi:chemotaxis signal transduction protein
MLSALWRQVRAQVEGRYQRQAGSLKMKPKSKTETTSFVLIQLGKRRFALPSAQVSELAPPVRLHTFPHTTEMVQGVIVRRRRIIPVYNVAPLLIGKESSSHRFYLVTRCQLENGEELCAIPVNGECELRTADALLPGDGAAPYVSAVIFLDGQTVEVLDLGKLAGRDSAPYATAALDSDLIEDRVESNL